MNLLKLRKYIGAVAYPPGSIYCTTEEIDPASIWGGTWEKLEGRFLLGSSDSYTVGSTGGAKTVTLTIDQIPAHTGHLISNGNASTGGNTARYLDSGTLKSYGSSGRGWNVYNGNEAQPAAMDRGGGKSHNNMPPYQVVHMWRRKSLRGGTD